MCVHMHNVCARMHYVIGRACIKCVHALCARLRACIMCACARVNYVRVCASIMCVHALCVCACMMCAFARMHYVRVRTCIIYANA